MQAKDYPVTFPYGATTAPYSPAHPHTGEDRKMPLGTAIEVNGVQVGIAGTTGQSTGVHTHTQRVFNGLVVHPQGGGFEVPQPTIVTETGYKKDSIGFYVRYRDGNGFIWSIFHMDKPAGVHVGQQLIKGEPMFNEGDRVNLNVYFYGKDIGKFKTLVGVDWKTAMYSIFKAGSEFDFDYKVNEGDIKNIDSILKTANADIVKAQNWKDTFYLFVANNLPTNNFVEVKEKLFKKV